MVDKPPGNGCEYDLSVVAVKATSSLRLPAHLEPLHSEGHREEDAGGQADVAAALHHRIEGWGGIVKTKWFHSMKHQ